MEELQSIQRQLTFLKCSVTFLMFLCAGLAFNTFRVQAAEKSESLTLKRLTIVDDAGTARVILAAPAPDPIVKGKKLKRSGPVAGVLIYDKDGNERGGYLTANDETNGAMLTLDATDGQVFTIYANANNGATISLNNQKGDSIALTTWNSPVFQMRHKQQMIFNQPSDAPVLH